MIKILSGCTENIKKIKENSVPGHPLGMNVKSLGTSFLLISCIPRQNPIPPNPAPGSVLAMGRHPVAEGDPRSWPKEAWPPRAIFARHESKIKKHLSKFKVLSQGRSIGKRYNEMNPKTAESSPQDWSPGHLCWCPPSHVAEHGVQSVHGVSWHSE